MRIDSIARFRVAGSPDNCPIEGSVEYLDVRTSTVCIKHKRSVSPRSRISCDQKLVSALVDINQQNLEYPVPQREAHLDHSQ
jgi:hypothetical protein